MSDAAATAKLLGIEFDDADLGMTPEELNELMANADTTGSAEDDEAALMASLSEYGITDDEPTSTASSPSIAVPVAAAASAPPAPVAAPAAPAPPPPPPASAAPVASPVAAEPLPTAESLFGGPPVEAPRPAPPRPAPPRPPPVRYAKDHKDAARSPNRMPEPSDDLMDDLMKAFDFGKKAVKEAFNDAKQSVRDGFSVECSVRFLAGDARLGMRVERRPVDDALEVTWVDPGGAAARVGVRLDDVVTMVDRRTGGGGYDALLQLLTRGARPLELHLLRPQHILNSPVHFKLEDELGKAVRILHALTRAPEVCEDAGKDVMAHLLTHAVGFLFMTTVKIGGLVSGMGGTGILVARLADGSWSAPVAVASFGLSWGVQVGAALSDVMVVFTQPAAMDALRAEDGPELSLGPESGVAVGPVGRAVAVSHGLSHLGAPFDSTPSLDNMPSFDAKTLQLQSSEEVAARAKALQAEVAARAAEASQRMKPAYSYSHSKGLFVGVSLEGSALTVRHDVNTAFYGHRVNVGAALEGGLPRPESLRDAKELYAALKALAGDRAPPALAEPRPPAAWAPPRDKRQSGNGGASAASGGSGVPPRDAWANPFSEPASPSLKSGHSQKPQAQAVAVVASSALPPAAEAYGIGDESDGEVEEFSV